MKLLAIDTSTELCSAALLLDDACLERAELAGNRHSQLILPMVSGLLAESGLRLADLDLLAYGRGPGSFTGLRIACGVIQGLALGGDLPVLGVGTLEALAEEVGSERVITCLDARMHEVYFAAYERRGEPQAGGWREVSPPVVCRPDAVPLPAGNGWVGAGSGFAVYGETLAGRLGASMSTLHPASHPHARGIARLAWPRFLAGQAVVPDAAEPFYVRDKVALTTQERA